MCFLDRNGKDSDEGWGRETHYTLWELGFNAYKELGSPDLDCLIQLRETCLELFPAFVDTLQYGIDAGVIKVVGHIEVDDDGNPLPQEPTPIYEMGFDWLALAIAKSLYSLSKQAVPIDFPADLANELPVVLNYSILLAVDDALIAYQLRDSSSFGDAISQITEMAWLAEEIKNRPLMEQKARKDVARNAASAKLAKDPKQAAKREVRKLWDDWQSGRTLHKSAAAFARHVVDSTPAIESEESVKRWEREWRKEAKSKRQRS